MHFLSRTFVEAPLRATFARFDGDLFLRLAPPFPKLRLLRFDGCSPGDEIEVELDFLFFCQRWHSRITESAETDELCYFIDASEGRELPFFLRSWRHVHRLTKVPGGTLIEDDITYRSHNWVLDWLLYPSIWFQIGFWRKPIYRSMKSADQ